jgi:hypothetical protein
MKAKGIMKGAYKQKVTFKYSNNKLFESCGNQYGLNFIDLLRIS